MEIQRNTYEHGGIKYLVCSNGDIYGPTGKKLKPRKSDDGYAIVTMGRAGVKRSSQYVHRVVAKVFLPNPNNLSDVDHLDNNRMNPAVENLEWVTHEENIRRAYEKGSHIGRITGEKNPKARLTPELVLELRAQYKAGVTIQELVDEYGYPWNTIGNAVKYITWKHLP